MDAAVTVWAAGTTGTSAAWQLAGSILVAVIGVLGSLYTARATLRAANTTNATALTRDGHDRDQAIDARVDATNVHLWQRLDLLEARHSAVCAERDALAERLARLRLGVIASGLDPDALEALLRPVAPPPATLAPPTPPTGASPC